MNTATTTPRTDAAWASSFEPCEYRAAHTARTMRDECERLEIELATLRAERDQFRAQLHALRLVCGTTDADNFSTWVDRANARADRAEAEAERYRLAWQILSKVVAKLRAEVERLRSKEDAK